MKTHNLYNKTLKVYFWEDYFHTYTLQEDSKKNRLLSVTGITGVIDKSGPLMHWSANIAVDYIEESYGEKGIDNIETAKLIFEQARKAYNTERQKAADVGTNIHQWISEWIKSKDKDLDMPDDEKVINGITAFLKFQKENNFKWIESERIVYSKKNKFVGTLDAVARIGKDLVLVDFKSSKRNKYSKDGLYDEMKIQVCGYAIAWEEEMGKEFDKYMILRFDKESGEFEATELDKIKEGKKAFLNCLNLKRYLKSK